MFRKLLGKPRIIKTARSAKDINDAADKGYRPLVKEVVPSKDINVKFAIYQNKATGRIRVSGDYRANCYDDEEIVIDFTYYYPHYFDNPYAAYLIPSNIKIGEKVFLEDLIEDYVGWCWNQGDAYRLEGCDALWNGADFDILYEKNNRVLLDKEAS